MFKGGELGIRDKIEVFCPLHVWIFCPNSQSRDCEGQEKFSCTDQKVGGGDGNRQNEIMPFLGQKVPRSSKSTKPRWNVQEPPTKTQEVGMRHLRGLLKSIVKKLTNFSFINPNTNIYLFMGKLTILGLLHKLIKSIQIYKIIIIIILIFQMRGKIICSISSN